MLQFFRPRSFRMWAIVASLFAVFNVTGAAFGVARDSDSPCVYGDCADAGGDVATGADVRRRHSDVV